MIELQVFADQDIDRLLGWIDSREFLMQWAGPGFSFPLDSDQFREHLLQTGGPDPKLMAFKMVDTASQAMVGYLELAGIDRSSRTAMLARILVGPKELRGNGIGTQAVRAVLRIAFGQLGLHRVGLGVFDFNRSAIACYEKAGFRHEGVLRDARSVGGEYWSLCVMGILESEWRSSLERPEVRKVRSLLDLYAYNAWGNAQVFGVCRGLDRSQLERDAPGTVGTIEDTLKHMVGVEDAYLQMLRGDPLWGGGQREEYARHDLAWFEERTERLGEEYQALLAGAGEAFYGDELKVPWFDFRLTKHDGLLQVLNHSAQHRAQIFSVLGQRGLEVPSLDYVRFVQAGGTGAK